jgi:hypothetical protein
MTSPDTPPPGTKTVSPSASTPDALDKTKGSESRFTYALVVDDNVVTLGDIVQMTNRLGFKVLQAIDCQDAEAIFDRYQSDIDLPLVDLRLPEHPTGMAYEHWEGSLGIL